MLPPPTPNLRVPRSRGHGLCIRLPATASCRSRSNTLLKRHVLGRPAHDSAPLLRRLQLSGAEREESKACCRQGRGHPATVPRVRALASPTWARPAERFYAFYTARAQLSNGSRRQGCAKIKWTPDVVPDFRRQRGAPPAPPLASLWHFMRTLAMPKTRSRVPRPKPPPPPPSEARKNKALSTRRKLSSRGVTSTSEGRGRGVAVMFNEILSLIARLRLRLLRQHDGAVARGDGRRCKVCGSADAQ